MVGQERRNGLLWFGANHTGVLRAGMSSGLKAGRLGTWLRAGWAPVQPCPALMVKGMSGKGENIALFLMLTTAL